eukprot:CAMPEP_0117847894 /NCGR_PEP_ID=MMETSP0949-20121206/20064_1 /TAXON_ID=44440 /ORGANISM="Chattonella subsalsa, Strain CCMP2191" /LENGTH=71 /DNA_ID=CAMNT_0005694585 /DNA_START=209 /DNA_END=420 /DNA_ORIENTATION=-
MASPSFPQDFQHMQMPPLNAQAHGSGQHRLGEQATQTSVVEEIFRSAEVSIPACILQGCCGTTFPPVFQQP